MPGRETAGKLARFAPGVLCNAHPAVRAMDSAIRPLFPGATLAGTARTVRIPPGENAAIHRAVHSAKAGDVLVVDANGSRSSGVFGDLLALCCFQKGVRGVVIDGTIRDTEEIAEMGLPVFCLGANANPAGKSDPGEVGTEIECGGVPVRPGDFVVGGGDGVAVVREERIRARLAEGETTCEALGIEPSPGSKEE